MRHFFKQQLEQWPEAKQRYEALEHVERKTVDVNGYKMIVQFNPARILSSTAKVDAKSIADRKCFLCDDNRPVVQFSVLHDDFEILVNPFPIAPIHFTIPSRSHRPQLIDNDLAKMIEFVNLMPDMAVFYNGPKCGASAPDHFHFQAVEKSFLPIVESIESSQKLPFGIIILSGEALVDEFAKLIKRLPIEEDDVEPKMNILAWMGRDNKTKVVIIPRKKHRPSFYGSGEGQLLSSPASIDLGGVFVAPRHKDFDKIDKALLLDIFNQLCFTEQELAEYVKE